MAKLNSRQAALSRRIVSSILILLGILIPWWYLAPRFSGDIAVSGVAFAIGGVAVYWYGLIIALAILIGYELIVRPALVRQKIDENKFSTYVLLLVLCSLLGARLGFILQNISYYGEHWREVLALWYGGLSIHGAIAGGVLWTWYYAKKLKLDFLAVLDIISPAIAFGLMMGRFGNFFNQELIGRPANVPWKMYVSPDLRPPALASSEFFHPAFLYESILDLVVLIVLLQLARRQPRAGFVFFAFLGLYSIARFIVEFFRYSDRTMIAGLSLAQIVSIVLLAASVVFFALLRQRVSRLAKPKLVHRIS